MQLNTDNTERLGTLVESADKQAAHGENLDSIDATVDRLSILFILTMYVGQTDC